MSPILRLAKNVPSRIAGKILRKLNPSKYVEKHLGINCVDSTSVHLYGQIDFGSEPWILTFGKDVYITDGVKFITHDGGTLLFRDIVPDLEITKPITLGDKVYIGNNAILLPGVTVGNNVVIGAGAIVTKDVPANSVVAGVPARVIRTTDQYFEKLQKESLHFGDLSATEKDNALRKYYGRTATFRGNNHGR